VFICCRTTQLYLSYITVLIPDWQLVASGFAVLRYSDTVPILKKVLPTAWFDMTFRNPKGVVSDAARDGSESASVGCSNKAHLAPEVANKHKRSNGTQRWRFGIRNLACLLSDPNHRKQSGDTLPPSPCAPQAGDVEAASAASVAGKDSVAGDVAELTAVLAPKHSNSVLSFVRLIECDFEMGLTLLSPLKSWQQAWHKRGVLHALMGASIPIPTLVSGHHIQKIGSLKQVHLKLARLSGVAEWPVMGLEQGIETERYFLNALTDKRDGLHLTVKRRVLWHLGIHRRSGNHFFSCRTLGLGAPLQDWLLVWRDLGVLRCMTDALSGLIVPSVFASSSFAHIAPRISESETDVLSTHEGAEAQGHYVLPGKERRATIFLLEYLSLPSEVEAGAGRVAGGIHLAGELYVQGMTAAGANDESVVLSISPEQSVAGGLDDTLPLDVISLSHGVRHHTAALSPWCPLVLSVRRVLEHEHGGKGLSHGIYQALGLRLTLLGVARDRLQARYADRQRLPAYADAAIEIDSVMDMSSFAGHVGDVSSAIVRETSLPGFLPPVWSVINPVTREQGIVSAGSLDDLVVTHFMQTMMRAGSLSVRGSVGGGLKFRIPKLRDSDEVLSDVYDVDTLHDLEAVLRVVLSQCPEQSNMSIHMMDAVSWMRGDEGNAYRIPLMSLILEECAYLRGLAYPDRYPAGQRQPMRVQLNNARQSLHLFRLVMRTLFRAGLSQQDIGFGVRSFILDCLCGMGFDAPTRMQLVRASDHRYTFAALPFWRLVEKDQVLAEQQAIFGSTIDVPTSTGHVFKNSQSIGLIARACGEDSLSLESFVEATKVSRALSVDTYLGMIGRLESEHGVVLRRAKAHLSGLRAEIRGRFEER